MRTVNRGRAAEAAVLNAFVERDLEVLLPFGDGLAYDLVVRLPTNVFLRVQCKAARPYDGGLIFNSRTTDHGRGRLLYHGLADLFGAYCARSHKVYLVPVREISTFFVHLRLRPTRNNQQRGIRLAADFEFGRWTVERLGEIALDPHLSRTRRLSQSKSPSERRRPAPRGVA